MQVKLLKERWGRKRAREGSVGPLCVADSLRQAEGELFPRVRVLRSGPLQISAAHLRQVAEGERGGKV